MIRLVYKADDINKCKTLPQASPIFFCPGSKSEYAGAFLLLSDKLGRDSVR
ncbi:MAG: hypothetical protein K0R46_2875 [Herbinix sp.]|jgi:hypothetical protein|nr:hypothetical protein [Herbinix sp.]